MCLIIDYDFYKTVTKHHTCDYHRRHPGENWAGCTCSSSYGRVRKTEDELTEDERNIRDARIALAESERRIPYDDIRKRLLRRIKLQTPVWRCSGYADEMGDGNMRHEIL